MDEMTLTLNSLITEEQWDAITDVDFEHTNEISFHTKHGKIVKFVKVSAQPEQRWIPVTERLPDMRQIVLITNGKGNVRCGQYRGIDFVINGRQRWQWKGNTSEQVVAWQPLPEPYRSNT